VHFTKDVIRAKPDAKPGVHKLLANDQTSFGFKFRPTNSWYAIGNESHVTGHFKGSFWHLRFTTGLQRKRETKENLEKRSHETNVDSLIQVQLGEDGGGSTRRCWMVISGLWPTFHYE